MPRTDALVAGHLCLDIIPTFLNSAQSLAELLVPGKLIDVADAVLSTGGATSNTGLALHRLGFRVSIVGKIGDDYFGDIIVKIIHKHGEHLTRDMIIGAGEGSSYSVVINPPGVDRIFLHNAGANNTFSGDEIPDEAIDAARLIHFGYPPLMRKFYQDPSELTRLFGRARKLGVTTSLDMSRPDPDGESGRVDWKKYLDEVLPAVDVFLPSIDEIIYMTDPALFNSLVKAAGDGNPASHLSIQQVGALADQFLAKGPAIICFKLGNEGFYVKTTADRDRLAAMGRVAPKNLADWLDREIITGCRKVEVAGTTGAGDCTIAGFLGSLLKGVSPDEAVSMAVAVGGASVEARDSNSGVPAWDVLCSRLRSGWPTAACRLIPEDWAATSAGNYARK